MALPPPPSPPPILRSHKMNVIQKRTQNKKITPLSNRVENTIALYFIHLLIANYNNKNKRWRSLYLLHDAVGIFSCSFWFFSLFYSFSVEPSKILLIWFSLCFPFCFRLVFFFCLTCDFSFWICFRFWLTEAGGRAWRYGQHSQDFVELCASLNE